MHCQLGFMLDSRSSNGGVRTLGRIAGDFEQEDYYYYSYKQADVLFAIDAGLDAFVRHACITGCQHKRSCTL